MNVLTKTFKCVNKNNGRSANITGYHFLKSMVKENASSFRIKSFLRGGFTTYHFSDVYIQLAK